MSTVKTTAVTLESSSPCDWLTHQEYALFPPAICSHRRRCSRGPGARLRVEYLAGSGSRTGGERAREGAGRTLLDVGRMLAKLSG
eukprot:9268462-Pyramimonas_sp.AAC.1